MKSDPSTLEVWIDADFVGELQLVGSLSYDRGQVRFRYGDAWLKQRIAFELDPDLTLDKAPFFPRPEAGNFGVFLDSSPDRWGQVLMQRREALEAKDEGRAPRTLHAWDFLLGVQDATRQGALRFRQDANSGFLAAHPLSAPPLTSLREMEAIAFELSAKKIDNLEKLRKWLAVLVAPGASLGGARPKANFTDKDGSLWIAKFPSREDVRDVGGWEWVVHQLASAAGIEVPEARVVKLASAHHTFCVKRFDRADGRRRFFSSAMTLLRKSDGATGSYLEIVEFIQKSGARNQIAADQAQLFKRVVFNIMVGNRDDHLRNHGFILTANGWRLSPAYDMNPSIEKSDHALAIDESDNRPDLDTAVETAAYYGLHEPAAKTMIEEIRSVVREWPEFARKVGIARADISLMGSAFSSAEKS
ncbi:MAG: type II toxin-antitoxin system HipA family toxin [Burkholderiales bacterium]|nr:type II toxin-antitoxin system HipA family toxin [Burkholderiales bacterium]